MCLKTILDMFMKSNTAVTPDVAPTVPQPQSASISNINFNDIIITKNSLKWEYIVLHHSWSPDNNVTSDWDGIKRYQMSWRYNDTAISSDRAKALIIQGKKVIAPDLDIAYNFGLEYVNKSFVYRIGRPLSMQGAHTIGFNYVSIGICIIGNYDLVEPDIQQYDMLVKLCKELQRLYNIPNNKVIGHRETYAIRKVPIEKSCPGNKINLDKFRGMLI